MFDSLNLLITLLLLLTNNGVTSNLLLTWLVFASFVTITIHYAVSNTVRDPWITVSCRNRLD